MNRWLLSGIIVIGLVLALPFLILPSQIKISRVVPVKCTVPGAARILADTSGWEVWWPDGGRAGNGRQDGDRANGSGRATAGGPEISPDGHPVWTYGSGRYCVLQRLLRTAVVRIDNHGRQASSQLVIYPHGPVDSCLLEWSFQESSGWNPIRRWQDYFAARAMYTDIGVIMEGLRGYLENARDVYGIDIVERGKQDDTLVVETSRMDSVYPTTEEIYAEVRKLERRVTGYGGRVTGHPIMNVTPAPGHYEVPGHYEAPVHYELRVALPVDRKGKEEDDMRYRSLPRIAPFLEADVRGGDLTVREALRQMENYIADHQKTVMAIPFLSLVTDRTAERDTSKWVTRIYYPVFYSSSAP